MTLDKMLINRIDLHWNKNENENQNSKNAGHCKCDNYFEHFFMNIDSYHTVVVAIQTFFFSISFIANSIFLCGFH